MDKLNYLNLGCGKKYHRQWVNIDMTAYSEDVIAYNLLKGIPFPDNTFDVVYHSQVLEHIPREQAPAFLKECHRVLNVGGTLRVVVPDLENIVDEYKKWLNQNLEDPTPMSEANYEWVMLELLDQLVRNHSGGLTADYLKRIDLVNERYVIDRIGYVGKHLRDKYIHGIDTSTRQKVSRAFKSFKAFKTSVLFVLKTLSQRFIPRSKAARVGTFRLGGEVHMWMYDRYSLSKLLAECGFEDITVRNPFESSIPNWNTYELDVKDGMPYDPTSLFIEARKMR